MPLPKTFKLAEPKITDVVRGNEVDPKLARRERMLTAIGHQISLAKDASFKFESEKYTKGADGKSVKTKTMVPPRPWFKQDAKGEQVELSVRYGNRPLFGTQVIATTKAKLGSVLETLKKSVEAGDLDEELSTIAARAPKKAAA